MKRGARYRGKIDAAVLRLLDITARERKPCPNSLEATRQLQISTQSWIRSLKRLEAAGRIRIDRGAGPNCRHIVTICGAVEISTAGDPAGTIAARADDVMDMLMAYRDRAIGFVPLPSPRRIRIALSLRTDQQAQYLVRVLRREGRIALRSRGRGQTMLFDLGSEPAPPDADHRVGRRRRSKRSIRKAILKSGEALARIREEKGGDRPIARERLATTFAPARRCQWIAGEPTADDSCKCMAPSQQGHSYCAAHVARAYRKDGGADERITAAI